jgi:hypothetical protein
LDQGQSPQLKPEVTLANMLAPLVFVAETTALLPWSSLHSLRAEDYTCVVDIPGPYSTSSSALKMCWNSLGLLKSKALHQDAS